MSNLTSEQLAEMAKRVNERLAEFEIPAGIGVITQVPRGVVRVVHDVVMEFWDEDVPPPQKPEDDKMLLTDMYVAGMRKGRAEAAEAIAGGLKASPDGLLLAAGNGLAPLSSGAVARVKGDGVHEVVESLTQGKRGPGATTGPHVLIDHGNELYVREGARVMSDMEKFEAAQEGEEQEKHDGAAVEDAPPNHDKKSTEVDEIKARAYQVIRDLAKNGEMPRQSDYDNARPEGLPSRVRLSQITGLSWSEMAAELELTIVPPYMRGLQRKAEVRQEAAANPEPVTEVAAETAQPEAEPVAEVDEVAVVEEPAKAEPAPTAEGRAYADKYAEVRRKMRERAYEFIASIAVEGRMPLEDDYNAKRPTTVPVARDMMARLGFATWREVAEDVGLKWPPKPRQ